MRHRHLPRSSIGLSFFVVLAVAGSNAMAQYSVYSQAETQAGNFAISNYATYLSENNASDGSTSTATVMQSFSGLDGSGQPQTMTYSASASGTPAFGALHVYASGTLTNTYYNAANPVYFNSNTNTVNPAGSPDNFEAHGTAQFTDTLQYGGELLNEAGYQASYVFNITGSTTGVFDGWEGLATLSVSIAGNTPEVFYIEDPGTGTWNFATHMYPVNGYVPQQVNVSFDAFTGFFPKDVADGSTLSATADFSDTATLSQINIYDANGDPVSGGVTVTSESGTTYTVPEPTAVAVALPALMMALRTRPRRIRAKGQGPLG